jgi:S1-C subfamily serine protease
MGEDETVEIVGRVAKSVVNINTLRVLRDVFYQVVPMKGMGSGFIFNDDGYILTNNHVIANADRITVTLTNGRVLEGRLVGTCRSEDIAVIKIDAKDLVSAELGDSSKLKVGQRVFAIGNPFGLSGGPTVTSGVVSAVNRTIRSEKAVFQDLVQTDASINPGNSGGPLIDIKGRVIAINTAIIPFAQGIGFAIPINVAKECSRDIILYGSSARPWLGITGLSITKDIAEHYGLPVDKGVLVADIVRESPAERAGIEQNDIVLEIDDTEISSVEQIQKIFGDRKAGDSIEISILRESRRGRLKVRLERMP